MNRERHPHHELLRRATGAALAVALGLVVLKGYATWRTGSTAILGTLLDSSLDVLASLVNLLAVRHALVPADAEHRFGHGKAEQLAGLGQSLFISVSAVLLGVRAAANLAHPPPLMEPGLGVVAMVVDILATLGLVGYQRRVVRLTRSTAIRADSLHYTSDLLLHASVLLGLWAWWGLGWSRVDAILGIGIAGWLLFSAVRVGWDATQGLMDRELPESVRRAALAAAKSQPEVRAVHDLRTRLSGSTPFIQLEIDVDPSMTLRDAHDVSARVQAAIIEKVPGSEVLIHLHPSGTSRPDTAL